MSMDSVFTEQEAAAKISFDIRGEARDKRNRLKRSRQCYMTQPGSDPTFGTSRPGSLSRAEPGSFFHFSPTLATMNDGGAK